MLYRRGDFVLGVRFRRGDFVRGRFCPYPTVYNNATLLDYTQRTMLLFVSNSLVTYGKYSLGYTKNVLVCLPTDQHSQYNEEGTHLVFSASHHPQLRRRRRLHHILRSNQLCLLPLYQGGKASVARRKSCEGLQGHCTGTVKKIRKQFNI